MTMPPIENPAATNETTTTSTSVASTTENFALPDDFDAYVDEGEAIEIPSEGTAEPTEGSPGSTTSQQAEPVASGASPTGQQPKSPAGGTQQPPQTGEGQQPQQATPPQQPTEEGAPPRIYSPAELAQTLGQNRDRMIDALAQQKFALSPEEIQALDVDAVGVLPKIMARVYFEGQVNSLQQIANMVPRMVEHVANTRIAESDSERAFFEAWPNIDSRNVEHMKVVTQLSNSFRQMNPRASRDDAIKYVGQAATAFLNLPTPQRNSNGGQPPRGNGPSRRTPPFAPAQGGRAQPPAGTPTAPTNPFDGLGVHFDEG
jgi:hypothetical protein